MGEFALVLPGEPLAVRLMNTLWSDRTGVHDSLAGVEHLRCWSAAVAPGVRVTGGDLASFRALRDALRQVAARCTGARHSPGDVAGAVDVINRAVTAAPSWAELVLTENGVRRRPNGSGTPATRLLSSIAAQSVDLFADGRLAACRATGCVHFYLQADRRRQWCSGRCGNRMRVARHYRHHRSSGS